MDVPQVVAVLQGLAEVPASKFISCKQALDQRALASIASALSCKSHAGVKGLRLEGCSIGDSGARLVADALCSNTDLQTLELPNNYIGAEGATAFAQALQFQNCVLKVLDLSGNPCEFTAPALLQDIEKSLHRNRVIKRAADRRTMPSPSTPAISAAGMVSTPPATGRKLCFWPTPSENHHDVSLETEQRLQQLEDNYGMLLSELEHIRRLGSSLESWSKQVDAASAQVAAVLNLVDSTSQETLHRIVSLESWKAAADVASHSVSKVLQKLNEDIKYVDGRLSRLEGDANPSAFAGPTIVEIIDEPSASERASCSKVKSFVLQSPVMEDMLGNATREPDPSPSAGIVVNIPGSGGQSTPPVIPSTPRSMHSSLSDLRAPSPSPTATRLSPVTWHDNATAMAASLDALNLRNTECSPSVASGQSVPEDVEASLTPELEPAPAAKPECYSEQPDLEQKLLEQQALTQRLTARLEQMERFLSTIAPVSTGMPPLQTADCSVQTVPDSSWVNKSEEDPHCSVSATTIAHNNLNCQSAESVFGALSDTAGPSSKPLATSNPATEFSTVRQSAANTPVQMADVAAVRVSTLEYVTGPGMATMPHKPPQSLNAASNQVACSMESCLLSQPQPAAVAVPNAPEWAQPAVVPHTVSLQNQLPLKNQEPPASPGSPHTPAQQAAIHTPINSAMWLSSSTLLTPGSEASDSDVYQNLLRFVDGLRPNPMGVDLAEKLAVLARASQALSLREEQERMAGSNDVAVSVAASETRLPTVTPSPSTDVQASTDAPPVAGRCISPVRASLMHGEHRHVLPFPLHFAATSTSFDSSGIDGNTSSYRSSPHKPKSAGKCPPPPVASSGTYPTSCPACQGMTSSAGVSAATCSSMTSQGSSPFIPLASCDTAACTAGMSADTRVTSREWGSATDYGPLLKQPLWSYPEDPSPLVHPGPSEDDLSTLVRDVISQVDQDTSRTTSASKSKGLPASQLKSVKAESMDTSTQDLFAHPITMEGSVSFAASMVAKPQGGVIHSTMLQGSMPGPVADMGGSLDLQLPDGKKRPSTLPALPETRELPVDVSRVLPICPTPPTPINSAAELIPTLFNNPASPPPKPAGHASGPMSVPVASSVSHDGSMLMGSVRIRGSPASPADVMPSAFPGADATGAMSRVARIASRPVVVTDTLKHSDEPPTGHMQQARAGGTSSTCVSVPTTPTSSASSTPRPGGPLSSRQARARSSSSTTPTPRISTNQLPRMMSKPGECIGTALKAPKPDGRSGVIASQAQTTMADAKSLNPQPKATSTPFRDASMQRFLLRRGIGKRNVSGSPTPSNSSGTHSGGARTGSEHATRPGRLGGALDSAMDTDSGKGSIPASHGMPGRKKLMRAVTALTRPIKALMGAPPQDLPLRMHGPRPRRKSSVCTGTSSNDVSLMLAPRALSENTAAYYRYADANDSLDTSAATGPIIRRMMSETAAGQMHSHRYMR